MLDLAKLNFEKGGGMVTVVAVDAVSGSPLMLAHADRAALEKTIETGEMHYHSRSRGPWHKGATSGNTQKVVSLHHDCDGDAVLARVVPAGPACHTGSFSCFGELAGGVDFLGELDHVISTRGRASDSAAAETETEEKPSYTRRLLSDRNMRLKKLGEECAELILSCADSDPERAVEEAADVIYHVAVALRATGASLGDVRRELARRAR